MEAKKDTQILRSKPLKQLYLDVQLRRKFAHQKLQGKGTNQVMIRCEPHPKHCQIPDSPYMILIAPGSYELAYLSATIHSRVLGKNDRSSEQSIYLFCNNKLMTAFREKIGPYWEKNKEADSILYLLYSDTAPF